MRIRIRIPNTDPDPGDPNHYGSGRIPNPWLILMCFHVLLDVRGQEVSRSLRSAFRLGLGNMTRMLRQVSDSFTGIF
jgi:hypothetical protein